jgi:hypothetical protein
MLSTAAITGATGPKVRLGQRDTVAHIDGGGETGSVVFVGRCK